MFIISIVEESTLKPSPFSGVQNGEFRVQRLKEFEV